jgi:putative membrane protein
MHYASIALTALVAALHVWFMILESVLWRRPYGLKTFKMDQAKADATAPLALNQGLYNGFLAAGLVWSLVAPEAMRFPLGIFFLACVAVAGVVGGITASRTIFFVQLAPALLALGARLL